MAFAADRVIETFGAATEENQRCSLRLNQVVTLPASGEVWMTGDIHDHRRNFDKLLRASDLANHPERHVILHELIHGEHYDAKGSEDSWQTLYRAAELKCDFPDQVHFLLANHDLAQIQGFGIMKAGQSVCEAFTAGVKRDFPERGEGARVNVAITEFLLSLPLAIRTQTGIFFCHSLPAEDQAAGFDFSVFVRDLTAGDYQRKTGAVYQLIWGRGVTPESAAVFAEKVEASLVITGHQPQDTGYLVNGEKHLIIASDHNQGVFLPLDLGETYTMEQVVRRLTKFVALDV